MDLLSSRIISYAESHYPDHYVFIVYGVSTSGTSYSGQTTGLVVEFDVGSQELCEQIRNIFYTDYQNATIAELIGKIVSKLLNIYEIIEPEKYDKLMQIKLTKPRTISNLGQVIDLRSLHKHGGGGYASDFLAHIKGEDFLLLLTTLHKLPMGGLMRLLTTDMINLRCSNTGKMVTVMLLRDNDRVFSKLKDTTGIIFPGSTYLSLAQKRKATN